MKFTKVHGAGNDFVLFHTNDSNLDWANLATKICDRHFGVGADGILLLLDSEKADFRMRIFNQDGSEADACGNGLRSLVHYIMQSKLVKTEVTSLTVETMAGVRQVKIGNGGIQVFMGKPVFKASEIPVEIATEIEPVLDYPLEIKGRKSKLNFISMGNPHAVLFIEQPVSAFPLGEIGPEVEKHGIFPRHVNFEIARVTGKGKIEARVWERGVGETLACGSGACAIGVAYRLHGNVSDRIDITLPGGTLNVNWDGSGEVLLGGPAEVVFTGDWPQ